MTRHLQGLCWLVLALPLAGTAQESEVTDARAVEIEKMEPGLSSESLADMDAATPAASASERAPVLAADVSRSSVGNGVMDKLDLGRTEITGNQELPKVLYIVPWQKSDPGDLLGKPVNTLLDEVLAPVDRTEFMRRVDYYGDLNAEGEN